MTNHTCTGFTGDENKSLSIRIGALFGILCAGAIGFFLATQFRGRWRNLVFIFRTFAAGVVISTAFMHVMADAEIALHNPCLGLSDFPWVNVAVLSSTLFAFMFEYVLEEYVQEAFHKKHLQNGSKETNPEIIERELEISHRRVVAYTLESGIVFHSIFIGIGLGASHDPTYLRTLTIAILFHQAFEGISLGTAVVRGELGLAYNIVFGLVFSFMAPIGVFIGIVLGSSYNANSKASLAIEGAFNSISAGILIYNGLVDLILPTFDKKSEDGPTSKAMTYVGFFFMTCGAALMAIIAKWA